MFRHSCDKFSRARKRVFARPSQDSVPPYLQLAVYTYLYVCSCMYSIKSCSCTCVRVIYTVYVAYVSTQSHCGHVQVQLGLYILMYEYACVHVCVYVHRWWQRRWSSGQSKSKAPKNSGGLRVCVCMRHRHTNIQSDKHTSKHMYARRNLPTAAHTPKRMNLNMYYTYVEPDTCIHM